MDPARRETFPDWSHVSRLMAAKFRADHARHIGDPSFDQLVATLRKSSPEFCKLWGKHEVAQSGYGRKAIDHPVVGRLVFDHAVFHPQETPEQRMILYSPQPERGHAGQAGHAARLYVGRALIDRASSSRIRSRSSQASTAPA